MANIEKVKLKSGTLAGKAYRMKQCADGRWVPRDAAYPLSAAGSIAKTAVAAAKLEELESTKKAVEVLAKKETKAVDKGKVK